MEVVGNSVVVELAERSFLRTQHTGEVTEVVDRQRHVRCKSFANRLAVVPGLGDSKLVEVGCHSVGDCQQDVGPIGGRGLAPRRRCCVCGVECELNVLRGAAGDLTERLARDRGGVLEVLALDGCDALAADPVVVLGFVRHDASGRVRPGVVRHLCLPAGAPTCSGR